MRLRRSLFSLIILVLAIAACKIFDQAKTQATLGTTTQTIPATPATPEGATSITPLTQAPGGNTSASPTAGKKPPQSQAAEIRPPERRAELTVLSTLLSFQVLDRNGAVLGKISNYIINTCETYIIYFVMDPAKDLGFTSGNQLIIPFEVITINSGALDAQAKAIVLNLDSSQLRGAPSFPSSLQLFPLDWEPVVRAYWLQVARVSKLTSGCNVAGGSFTTHKLAYATQLLGVELKDGNSNLLGTVVEAILEPESGKLGFFVVKLQDSGGLVLVRLRAVNIPEAALAPGSKIELVLLTDNGMLLNAPKIDSVESATNVETQSIARQYWGG